MTCIGLGEIYLQVDLNFVSVFEFLDLVPHLLEARNVRVLLQVALQLALQLVEVAFEDVSLVIEHALQRLNQLRTFLLVECIELPEGVLDVSLLRLDVGAELVQELRLVREYLWKRLEEWDCSLFF